MRKKLVLDKDGVLVSDIGDKLHPEAMKVLNRAREDFDDIILWTLSSEFAAEQMVKRHNIDGYFSEVYGRASKVTVQSWENGYFKDLSVLGDPEEYVLIEDLPRRYDTPEIRLKRAGPLERVIYIKTFSGQKHELMPHYEQALAKFTSRKQQ